MYLILDTETSNFPQNNVPLDHPCQARILQLACVLLDKEFNEVASLNTLLKVPEGTQIHSGALAKHGITVDKCRKYGVTHEYAFFILDEMCKSSEVFTAFNVEFDKKMLDIEYKLLRESPFDFPSKKFCCAMESSTKIVKLPFANGRNYYGQKFKWPKLEEAYAFITHKVLEGAHDALKDCHATAEILKYLIENDSAIIT